PIELDPHSTLVARTCGAHASESELLRSEEARPAAERGKGMRGVAPRAPGREEPVRAVVRGPLGDIAGHVAGAERTHPELRARPGRRPGAEVRPTLEGIARIEGPPRHAGHAGSRHIAVASRLFPLEDGRELLSAEGGVRVGLVPRDVRYRIPASLFGGCWVRPVP